MSTRPNPALLRYNYADTDSTTRTDSANPGAIDLTKRRHAPAQAGATSSSSHDLCADGGRDLHIVDLTVTYGSGQRAVSPIKDLSMFAPCGRVTALLGRSGAGKTSLLSVAAAMLRSAQGQVWLGGINVGELSGNALSDYRRNQVGVVHQQYNLIASLSAIENVVVPMTLAGVGRKQARERAADLLQDLGMGAHASRKPGELSGGQQQRVAVARAIANNPSLVIADEPTAHLDGGSVEDVCTLLRKIADDGRTVLLSTHDDRLLAAADQIIPLQRSA
jgi:putative ABC transport system ATP-binding protein